MKKRSNKGQKKIPDKVKRIALKVSLIIVGGCLVTTIIGVGIFRLISSDFFNIKHFSVEGNIYLSDKEIIGLMKVKDKNIIRLNFNDLSKKMKASPWIKSVLLRKEYPDKLLVNVKEAQPIALLYNGSKVYLVDDKGLRLKMLAEAFPVLPVIRIHSDNKKMYQKTYKEVIKLLNLINENNFISDNRIEIFGAKPEDISMKIGEILILVGSGKYEKKLLNILRLKQEVERRNISVEYIDVRFSKRLIVKPVKSPETTL